MTAALQMDTPSSAEALDTEALDTEVLDPTVTRSTTASTTLDPLIHALEAERAALDDLSDVMRQQRAAVGVEDIRAVDDSVFAIHRQLLTMGELRQRRQMLTRRLGAHEETPLSQLDVIFDAPDMAPQLPTLRDVRDRLREAALRLSKEIEINRRILREVLASGELYAKQRWGQAAYGADGTPAAPPAVRASITKTA